MIMQSIQKTWLPEPTNILVERSPAKDGIKLSKNTKWQDIQGLSWTLDEETD